MILHYGKVPTGVKGGICQLSNLIYCSHSIVPFPESSVIFIAMMSFQTLAETNRSETGHVRSNYLNLQIANQTAQTFQLLLYIEDNCLVGEWLLNTPSTVQYHIYEENHHFTKEWWNRTIRHNQIFRCVLSQDVTFIRNEHITETTH
ncbi:hypothetical protein [Exiguobacterium sp. s6]|uniref:hypothetical protein n=1 Tax=Exiguobacterium sp. s6 TaxID=2751236 RepID=UPI003336BB81